MLRCVHISCGRGGAGRKSSDSCSAGVGDSVIYLSRQATHQWYEIQDLHVQETMPQMIGLSESYVLIYQRHDV